MKILNNSIFLKGVLVMGLMFSSCSDDTLDKIGTNPNNPNEVPIKVLMPQVGVDLAFGVYGTDLAWYSSVFVEHTAGVHGQLETADRRTGINSSIGNNSWNGLYADLLSDLEVIIERGSEGGEEEGAWTSVGIAKVLKAFGFSIATDLWGEIPFSEALQGKENRTPAFENQDVVYGKLQALLDEAIVDLNKTPVVDGPGNNDFYYSGNKAKWIKAAYALKARLYNRLSNIDPQGSATAALSAIENSFADASESLVFDDFTTAATGENPWFQESNDRSHHAVSETFYDIVTGLNDPRADIWFGTVGGEVEPAPNGAALTDQSGTIYSRASKNYLTATSPIPMITYEELKFIEAEANLRLGALPEAYEAYQEGVTAALEAAGVDGDDITDYQGQSSVFMGQGNLTVADIITQKYMFFWLFQPIEAYNDQRRTGTPTLRNSVGPAPNRFPYPQDEVAANPNVPKISFQTKVWWAQ